MIDIEIITPQTIDIDVDQADSTEIERVAGTTPDVTTWQGILGRPFTNLSEYFYVKDGKLYILTAEDIEEGNNMPPSSKAVYEAIKPLADRVANVKDGKDGLDGKDGKDGRDGYTPVKGVDYFDGENGRDGYTPRKNVDYFDGKDGVNGKDGKTPVKGVDYFDGTNGKDGKDFRYEDFTPEQLAKLKGEKGDKGEPGTITEETQAIIVADVLDELPAWSKAPTKPSYTASEVGALPDSTVIPTVPANVSAFNNDVGYLTEHQSLDGYAKIGDIPTDSHINDLINAALGVIENGSY